MRYTTVIDISEIQAIYRSHAARLLYLHLALKAGYHDDDRDLVFTSIRRLAMDVGISVSATRCALRQLEMHKLLTRTGTVWTVRKWVDAPGITPRALTKRQQRQLDAAAARRQEEQRRTHQQELERLEREQMEAEGKTSFMLYYEQQLEKANRGDPEAQRIVDRHRKTYELHQAKIKERKDARNK